MSITFHVVILQSVILYWMNVSLDAKPILGLGVSDDTEHYSIVLISKKNPGFATDFFLCTGGLITVKHVITAASCFENARKADLQVMASNDLDVYSKSDVSKMVAYSEWIMKLGLNLPRVRECCDLGILELESAIHSIVPAFLSAKAPERTLIFTGWGSRSDRQFFPNRPHKVAMSIIEKLDCESDIRFTLKNRRPDFILPDSLFCAQSQGHPSKLTWGDRGGPVFRENLVSNTPHVIVGIAINSNRLLEQDFLEKNVVNLMLHLGPFKKFISEITNRKARFVG